MEIPSSAEEIPIKVSLSHVNAVLRAYLGREVVISSFAAFPTRGFSAFTPTRSYAVHAQDEESYLLRVSPPLQSTVSIYAPNTLATEAHLSTLLEKHTSIPHAKVYKIDETLQLMPYPYLLLSYPRGIPLAESRASLSPRQNTLLDLRLGSYYKQLHEEVQNDWFGLPTQEKDELYSWQEAFTYLLESLLQEAREMQLEIVIPFEDVRRYLSRAIGSFLFDDCEVPSLVSLTGSEGTIFVQIGKQEDEVEITSMFSLSHALWGDPLLESMFIDDPSTAFWEGYGGSPIVFVRQRTKRMWYTLFLALMIIVQAKKGAGNILHSMKKEEQDGVSWAREAIGACIEKLKDAPCY